MADEKTFAEKLAAARAVKAAKELAEQTLRDVAELERFELCERLEKECGGTEGSAFVIVDVSDLGEGFVGLKLGEDVLWNTFKASKMNVVDVETFVAPCLVHPSLDEYRKLAKRRAFVPDRCASALASLYGVKAKADEGKF